MLPEPSEPETEEARASLTGLLRQVRATWVEDVLETIVPAGSPLRLRSDGPAVDDSGADGEQIMAIFEAADRSVLVLGARGAGKTTALLDLARSLVMRAEADPREPVPVILNLSSWSLDRQSLSEWMARQLSEYYRVPRRLGRQWLRKRRLVPLLDGLDEVDPAAQEACVRAINRFVEEGAPGLAVCCNEHVYEAIGTPLRLNAGFRLMPLTLAQIMRYLDESDDDLSTLREALRTDAALQELARTPLMLQTMVDAYRGLSKDDLVRDDLLSLEGRREHVFETYVQRSLVEADLASDSASPFDEDTVVGGTSWLARRMKENAQTVFLVERLQPTWLGRLRLRAAYVATSRIAGGIVLGIILGVIIEMAVVVIGAGLLPTPRDVAAKLLFGLIVGTAGGVAAAALDVLRVGRGADRVWSPSTAVLMAAYIAVFGIIGGAVIASVTDADDLFYGIAFGIAWGTVFWMFFGSPRGRTGLHNDIAIVEALRFSRKAAWRYAGRGMLAGAALGAAVELVSGLGDPLDPLVRVLTAVLVALLGGVAGAVIGFVLGGLQRAYVESRRRPNEGIRLSVRNMLLGGFTVATAAAVLLVPLMTLLLGSWWGAAAGVTGSLFAGLLAALWYGGMDVLQHYILRLILRLAGEAPHPLTPFLEYAVRLDFLQRVGGGYLFLNDFILTRFAALEGRGRADEQQALADVYVA